MGIVHKKKVLNNQPQYYEAVCVYKVVQSQWIKPAFLVTVCFMGRVELFTGNTDDFT